ncbi:RidA family protein [Fulvivirga lutea]|uniref:RidA family protein n=1 Tax=Fulvivirga lutea TaxID=2810512 RepID=A0A975A1N0_9BACT|nr:RidA family protein [Fulvivirga lutea]QSE98604.1 RidA family protein [Fulvivirga lutea]
MKKIVNSNKAPEPIGPYSQAVMAGDTLYVSGQIAIDRASGELVQDSIKAETKKVMENLGHVLAEAKMSYSNIVKCSIFIKNMEDFGSINEVYGEYFKELPPARETVEVSKLPKNVNVEISCIAVR